MLTAKYFRSPCHQGGHEMNSWERLPLAAMAATIMAVIQAAPIFEIDRVQRAAGNRTSSAWITHLAEHLDKTVLPGLPSIFGAEYAAAETQPHDESHSMRVSTQMLYDLAVSLHLDRDEFSREPLHTLNVAIQPPMFPPVSCCPNCGGPLYRSRSGNTYSAWCFDSSTAVRTPVFLGECRNNECKVVVHPDQFSQKRGDDHIYFPSPQFMQIGKAKFASQSLRIMVSNLVVTGHLPLSTFAECWNKSQPPSIQPSQQNLLQHGSLWQLFLLQHALRYTPVNRNLTVTIPLSDDEDEDAALPAKDPYVRATLALFPSVPSGKFRTYQIPGTADHICAECAHFSVKFLPGQGGPDCTDAELVNAHRSAVTDYSRIVTACSLDGIEKIGHKVRYA